MAAAWPDRSVENGISCMTCHVRGLIPKSDQIRMHVERNPGAFSVAERETILALYPPEDRFGALLVKDNERFVIKGGAMANALMTAKDVKVLATMPGRQELLAKLAGTMQAPIVKLARTLNEIPGKFVRTLAAVRDAKEKPAG